MLGLHWKWPFRLRKTRGRLSETVRGTEMDCGYPAKVVANTFLQRDFEDRKPTITPMKLQKLVYCLHGWHLAITGKPVINSKYQVWEYGPVEEGLYHLFKNYGGDIITEYAKDFEPDIGDFQAYVVGSRDKTFQDIFDAVNRKYMPLSAIELSALTHQPGTPWSEASRNRQRYISNESIEKHFRSIVGK